MWCLRWLGTLLVVLLAASGSAQEKAPAPLTASEVSTAAAIADENISAKSLKTEGRLVFVGAALFRDKDAESRGEAGRLALVTHYRYDGDLTISTVVDFGRRVVVSFDSQAHVATPLAAVEVERAKTLALADARVTKALGTDAAQVQVEALLLRTAAQDDPLFGKRAVTLLFRKGRTYVRMPGLVNVDLTSGTVLIDERKEAEPHAPHD